MSVFVGDWGATTHPVMLAAYDASGLEIGEQTAVIRGGAGIHTQLTVSSSSETIFSFSVFVPGTEDTFARVAIDNLSFDNSGTAAAGSPLADLLDTIYRTPDVSYLGEDRHVHIQYFDGSWHTTDVTAAAGAPNAAAGSPLADLLDTIYGTPDVFYLGADQHVHLLYFNGRWHTTDVTAAAN